MTLQIINDSSDESKNYVRNKMFEYNRKHFPDDLKGNYQEIHIFLRDEEGQVCGGILGETCWNWLEIQYLFVDEAYRGLGYGRKLIQEAEKIARDKHLDFMKVDTLSFQAFDFTRKRDLKFTELLKMQDGTHTII